MQLYYYRPFCHPDYDPSQWHSNNDMNARAFQKLLSPSFSVCVSDFIIFRCECFTLAVAVCVCVCVCREKSHSHQIKIIFSHCCYYQRIQIPHDELVLGPQDTWVAFTLDTIFLFVRSFVQLLQRKNKRSTIDISFFSVSLFLCSLSVISLRINL